MRLSPILAIIAMLMATPVLAQSVNFGDDSSEWSNDGECDDKRFEGPGMTTTPLLDADIGRDATDCMTAYNAGRLTLRGEGGSQSAGGKLVVVDGITFGDDGSEWSNDGECDDPRFEGRGMTTTPLLSDDIMRDASDCRAAYDAGRLQPRGVAADGTVDFGDDNGEWSNDGECDDMRFEGPGMTTTPLLSDDIMHDATDCRTAFNKGRLTLVGQ